MGTLSVRDLLALMGFARGPEVGGVGVEGPEGTGDVGRDDTQGLPLTAQGLGVRRLHGSEAAVAAPQVGGADRAAAGLGDRAEARRAPGHGHARRSPRLALRADTAGVEIRAPAREE